MHKLTQTKINLVFKTYKVVSITAKRQILGRLSEMGWRDSPLGRPDVGNFDVLA